MRIVEPLFEFSTKPMCSQDLIGAIFSVVGDIPFNSETLVMVSPISRICRFNLSEALIKVGLCACIHKSEYMSIFVCTIFRKKDI